MSSSAEDSDGSGGPGAGSGGRSGGASGGGKSGGSGGTAGTVGPIEDAPVRFACDAKQAPPEIVMRRMTAVQYRNTIADLLAFAIPGASLADPDFAALRTALDSAPVDKRKTAPDDPHGSYRRLDQDVQQAHVNANYAVATAFASAVTSTARLPALLGSCASAANTNSCVEAFERKFAERALRRPLSNEEASLFHGVYGTGAALDPAALGDVVAVILNHPAVVFLTEHGSDTQVAPGSYKLTPFELASRLSYHFWQTMPDDALWAAAKSGALASDAGYAAQVDRLFSDPRTSATLDGFMSEWLKLEDVQAIRADNQTPLEKAFIGKASLTRDLRQHMVDEVVDLTRHLIWKADGSMSDLLTTDLSFAKTPDLLGIYGLGSTPATPAAPLRLQAAERPGVLTRAAFLANGSTETRPIMKGVFIRKNVLCDELPPPPNNASTAMLAGDVSRLTTRQRIQQLTETPGSNCASCHTAIINPLGFATENFDALGRARAEQVLFDASGREIGRAPVDTKSVPGITPGDKTTSAGAADLMRMVASSGKAEACLARNYFRFAVSRWDDPERDGCALEQLRTALVRGGSLKGMLREVSLTDAFKTRTFQ